MSVSEARSSVRVKFFEFLFGEQQGYLCIGTKDHRAANSTFRQEFFMWPDEKIRMEEFILSVEEKLDVYFCINLLSKKIRKKEHCLQSKLIWADMDDIHPDSFTELPPSIIIQSSINRWQAFWRLTTYIDPDQAEEYSRRVAYATGADRSGWDLTQLFRVTLTTNFKYRPPVDIELTRCLEIAAKPILFESLPDTNTIQTRASEFPMPDLTSIIPAGNVIQKYLPILQKTEFMRMYGTDPTEDWSRVLWRFIHECFRIGMTQDEVFAVSLEAKCNKYARDGRPIEHLWRDVLKAAEIYKINLLPEPLLFPELVKTPHSDTFLNEYRAWGESVTDAAPEFHELCMIVALSAIISNSVRLETSIGGIVPNLWGMLLGDSTLTRKTTAMRLVMDMLVLMDNELVVANNASPEGLLEALAERPNRSSMWFKDEISGFLNIINRREYLQGMPEMLTELYDVPPLFIRRLRKETIIIESPAF